MKTALLLVLALSITACGASHYQTKTGAIDLTAAGPSGAEVVLRGEGRPLCTVTSQKAVIRSQEEIARRICAAHAPKCSWR